MTKPERVQRKRTRGFKMPVGAVYVGRPTKWGNPYSPGVAGLPAARCSEMYRAKVERMARDGMLDLTEIRGKDLACWCKLGEPCHADILLEIANREEQP